jgi:hypothetical protein
VKTSIASLGFAVLLATTAASAQEAERTGARVGLSLTAGYAGVIDAEGNGHPAALVGPTFRVGGALTDRFHLLGELTLQFLPGATVAGDRAATAWNTALTLSAQGYIGPRFFLRGGGGVGWMGGLSDSIWYLPLPGARFTGGLGYDVWRQGERSISVTFDLGYASMSRTSGSFDHILTLALGVGVDWY